MNAEIDNIQKPAGDRPVGFCPFCDYQVMGPGVCSECGESLSSEQIVNRSPSKVWRNSLKWSIRIVPILLLLGGGYAVYRSNVWHSFVPTDWLIENGLSESWSKQEVDRRLSAGALTPRQLTAFYSKHAAVDLDIWFDADGCQFAIRVSKNRPLLGRLSIVPHIAKREFSIDGESHMIQGRSLFAFNPIRPHAAGTSLHYVSSDLAWDEIGARNQLIVKCTGSVVFRTNDPVHTRELARIGNKFPFSVTQTVDVPAKSQTGPRKSVDLTDL